MDSQTLNFIMENEKSRGHLISKEDITEHISNLEHIRVNHILSTDKIPSHCPYKHGIQIMRYARAIAQDLGCPQKETALIALAAKFHDIGKIKIDNSIINKADKLTPDEYEQIKMHTVYGQELMIPLYYIANLIRHHHERYDGNGYPDGLVGERISLGSRIIAVIDTFNAMTHKRSYNHVKTKDEAIVELKKNAGTQFDPNVVKSFISVLNSEWLEKNIDFVDIKKT